MRKVLIPTKLNSIAATVLEDNDFQVVQDANAPFNDIVKANSDAMALIVRSETIDAEIIDMLPILKVIVRAGAGYDNIDIKHARRKGIDVMNTPGANSNAVAEEVVAMILAAYRFIIPGDASTRKGQWEKKRFLGRELTLKTVGIVGLGNIGQLVARRLAGFENRLLAFDPVVSARRAEELGVELCSLDSLFEQSDIITLHVPATEETRNLVNADLLGKTKPRVMIINCARNDIVDEDALRAAKAEKQLLFCNDVYPHDAPGEKSVSDIADVMLPHLGANTEESNYNAARRAAEQLIAIIDRGVTTHVVNSPVPEGLDESHMLLAYYLTRVAREFLGTGERPRRIEASFYGGLDEFSEWLCAPIVRGLSADFDPSFDSQDAADYLKEKGVEFISRKVDEAKHHGKSMTIDLLQGEGRNFTKVSVRGTIAEANTMVSRIDDFDKLYFEPRGMSVLVVYQDQPGMLAKITGVMARHSINIDDIRAPHDKLTGESMAALKVNKPVIQLVLDEILAESGFKKASYLEIK